MVPASIPLLAPGNPSNYLLDPSRPRSREWSVSSDGAGLASLLGELVTPRGQQPRPSKHTIRVGEPRERERGEMQLQWGGPEPGRRRGLLLGHWASASHHKARPGTRLREGEGDNLQICLAWQCDQTSDNVQTPGWPEVRGLAMYRAELGLTECRHDRDSGPATGRAQPSEVTLSSDQSQ